MKQRHIPYDIENIPRYPKALQIYRIPASPSYQVRLFSERKYIRRSTRTSNRHEAVEFAKKFYDEIAIAKRLDFTVHTDTFAACARHLLENQEAMMKRGERRERFGEEDKKKLDKDLLPFFGTMGVAKIGTLEIREYLNQLTESRELSPSTLSKHLVVIRKVLNEAKTRNYISTLPIFPPLKMKDNPRSWFSEKEYRILRDTACRLAKQDIKVRGVPLTEEIYDFIVFHMNVFVRVSDIKLTKHRHTSVENNKGEKYLLIVPTNSKTTVRDSASMETAAVVYERILARNQELDLAGRDDYLFFPQYKNRAYALATIRRQFEHIVNEAQLKYDRFDNPRTLYSLRHSALMFRLLNSEQPDIFFLARNALTSVQQLERFYLSHIESRMKIENLHSFKRRD